MSTTTEEEKNNTATNLNPLQDESVLDEGYYRRLTKELTRGGTNEDESGGGMVGSRTYSEEDFYNEENQDVDSYYYDDDYDDKLDFYDEQADKAEEIGESYENRRAGAWKRNAGPKARGQKVQDMLEKLREVTASLNAAEDAARQLRAAAASGVPPGRPIGGAPSSISLPATASRSSLASRFNPRKVLEICEKYDDELSRLIDPSSKKCNLLMARVPSVPSSSEEPLIAAYDHMIENLYTPFFRSRFNGHCDDDLLNIPYGGSVPSYFANVGGETIFRRKMLSILGLKNLIKYGPRIFTDLRNQLFSGNPAAYSDSTGLGLMRVVTGNVVDLDTTVLRLTDRRTMDAVNMMNKHKGLRTYNSLDEFARSDDAREIAVNCAKSALQDFIDLFKLTKTAAVARKVDPDSISASSIPIASTNTDRGRYPLWEYRNVGQHSFHANCPTMDDVVGALLKLPFHAIKQYAFLALQEQQQTDNSSSSSEFKIPQTKLTRYFEECLGDFCFNLKWRSCEDYAAAVAHEGTIVDILQKLQMDNQAVFTAEFFAADDEQSTKEKAKMFELVEKKKCVGKEAVSGKIRSITKSDVDKWVSDPSCKI